MGKLFRWLSGLSKVSLVAYFPGSLAASIFNWQAALPWGVSGQVKQGLNFVKTLH